MTYKCPKCGEEKNLHYNYDWTKQTRPITDVLCNECGQFFGKNQQSFSPKDDKKSSHWLDAFTWVRKVYLSCTTKEQEITAERLLLNFERLYSYKDTLKFAWDLRDEYLKIKFGKK